MTTSEEALTDNHDAYSGIAPTPAAVDDCSISPAVGERTKDEVLPSETNPTALGVRVVSGLRHTVRAVIDACVLITETVRRFDGDREALDEFLGVLADGNVIPWKQARLGSKSSKLSKLRKIGDYADLLCRDEIIKHLEPGYTINYHVPLLYEALPGDEEARIKRLAQILQVEGGLSREFLIQQTRLAEKAARSLVDPEADLRSASVTSQDREFDLILLTPNRRDLQRMGEDYVGDSPQCLRVHERVAKKAAALVIASLVDFPTIANRLLPRCGFENVTHVFLVREPLNADVTGAQVIAIAERGGWGNDHTPDFQWLANGESLDAGSLASRLVPAAVNRLHVFAPTEAEGWCSIIGEANWSQDGE